MEAKIQKLKPFTKPVKVTVHCSWEWNRRHDIDSVLVKPVLDALVESGYLVDDNLNYVRSVTFTGETGAESDGMVLSFEEV